MRGMPFAVEGGFEYDGVFHEDLVSAFVCGVLGGCGCGNPVAALKLAVELVAAEPMARVALFKKSGVDMETERGAGIAFGLMYWLDAAGLLEHGGGIMGSWPSERGKDFVAYASKALGM